MSQQNLSTLKLLSWNIAGLDPKDLEERTQAVLEIILDRKPDVVLLQEVVQYSLEVFKSRCNGYIVLVGKPTSLYFNAILIRSCTVNVERSSLDTLEFENSAQGRHFLTYPIRFSGAEVILMTSHLESCGSETSERKRQFNDILLYMRRRPNGVNVIFGGDTNLRDNEVVAVGGLPDEVCDTWVTCGSPTEAEFTWDMSENDNMVMPDGREPRLRFDQIFLRSAQTGKVVKPQYSPILGNNDWAVEDLQVITGEYGWNLASSEKFICSYLLHGLDI